MLNLEQAREVLDTIVRQVRLTREEHSLAAQALEVLYDGAKEFEEQRREMKNPVPEAA